MEKRQKGNKLYLKLSCSKYNEMSKLTPLILPSCIFWRHSYSSSFIFCAKCFIYKYSLPPLWGMGGLVLLVCTSTAFVAFQWICKLFSMADLWPYRTNYCLGCFRMLFLIIPIKGTMGWCQVASWWCHLGKCVSKTAVISPNRCDGTLSVLHSKYLFLPPQTYLFWYSTVSVIQGW